MEKMGKISTRFKDANGVEIFEGDVLMSNDEGVVDVVKWSPEFQYHLENNLCNCQSEFDDWVVIGSANKGAGNYNTKQK